MTIKKVCVYCASSRQSDSVYHHAAAALGRILAHHSISIVYGGGSVGSMGSLADAALAEGGLVVGVIPRFMYELEWGHRCLTKMLIVDDLRERTRLMLEEADAVIALPGGCGTLDELFEAITLKRLGCFLKPIVMINVQRFFDPCILLLESCIREKFMSERHRSMWSVVEKPDDVVDAIRNAPPWDISARDFAAL